MRCHADKHKDEEMHASLLDKKKDAQCKVCGEETYCKGFCYYHYGQYRNGIRSLTGKQLKILKQDREKSLCIICQVESVGYTAARLIFCAYHYDHYYRGIINIKGEKLRDIRNFRHADTCKICDNKYYSRGFCVIHYQRFKVGQIDAEGNELRPLGVFNGPKIE